MASETGIDVVYRSAILDFDTPVNKTLQSLVFDGFSFIADTADATSNAVTLKIYGFNNVISHRTVLDAPVSVTYTDACFSPHVTVHPRAHGKSFVLEWSVGVTETSPELSFVDFFGTVTAQVADYTRTHGVS